MATFLLIVLFWVVLIANCITGFTMAKAILLGVIFVLIFVAGSIDSMNIPDDEFFDQ